MRKRVEAAAIKKLEAEYSPSTERFELEDWIASRLFDTYHNLHEEESDLFRFRETALVYVPEAEILNITKIIDKHVVEHCLLLSDFLYKNYGIKKLGNRADIDMELMLSECDFELMAIQITNDLMEWYERMNLVDWVLTKKEDQQNP